MTSGLFLEGSYRMLLFQAAKYERAANFFIFSIFNDLIFLKRNFFTK
jgi:hypothetical protein